MKEIYHFNQYKPYLVALWGSKGRRTGARARAAEHLGCQTAYVSQVLSGHAHFSLEQAHKINELMGHDDEASHYFMLLVQKDRAGTKELEAYFQSQMDEVIAKRTIIKNRVSVQKEIPEKARVQYYSSWLYLAVHMLCAVKELQTKEALAERLSLPLKKVSEVLDFLTLNGLLEQKNDRYIIDPTHHTHLGQDSEVITRHHSNWRLQALQAMDRGHKDNLHYSVVYSLSQSDAVKIRDQIIDLIQKNLKVVEPSKEETVYVNTIDFFELRG